MKLSPFQSLKPFDVYGLGAESWKEGEGDEIEDRIRHFAEDADNIQGFQIFSDNFNGFGGLTGLCVLNKKKEITGQK